MRTFNVRPICAKVWNFWGPDLKCPCHSSFWPNDESTLSAEIPSKSENLLSCYPFLPFFICKGRIPNSETCALWFDTFSFPLVTPKFHEKNLNEISFALRSRLFPFQPASLNSVRRMRFKCSHLSRKCCNCNVVYKWCWKHLRDASVNKKQSKAIAKKELKPPFETLILFLFWHYL